MVFTYELHTIEDCGMNMEYGRELTSNMAGNQHVVELTFALTYGSSEGINMVALKHVESTYVIIGAKSYGSTAALRL